jgi:hypothetical protein
LPQFTHDNSKTVPSGVCQVWCCCTREGLDTGATQRHCEKSIEGVGAGTYGKGEGEAAHHSVSMKKRKPKSFSKTVRSKKAPALRPILVDPKRSVGNLDALAETRMMRKSPSLPNVTENPYFDIMDHGERKLAQLKEGLGYRDDATGLFIKLYGGPLQRDIGRARDLSVSEYGDGPVSLDAVEVIKPKCPTLSGLCTSKQIQAIIEDRKRRTHLQSANEVFQWVLPQVSRSYIERRGRKRTYTYQPRTKKP